MKKTIVLLLFFCNWIATEPIKITKKAEKITTNQKIELAKTAVSGVIFTLLTLDVMHKAYWKTYYSLCKYCTPEYCDSSKPNYAYYPVRVREREKNSRKFLNDEQLWVMYASYFFMKEGIKKLKK